MGNGIYYYPTGQILTSGEFKEGKFIDKWNEFSIDGKIIATTDFK